MKLNSLMEFIHFEFQCVIGGSTSEYRDRTVLSVFLSERYTLKNNLPRWMMNRLCVYKDTSKLFIERLHEVERPETFTLTYTNHPRKVMNPIPLVTDSDNADFIFTGVSRRCKTILEFQMVRCQSLTKDYANSVLDQLEIIKDTSNDISPHLNDDYIILPLDQIHQYHDSIIDQFSNENQFMSITPEGYKSKFELVDMDNDISLSNYLKM